MAASTERPVPKPRLSKLKSPVVNLDDSNATEQTARSVSELYSAIVKPEAPPRSLVPPIPPRQTDFDGAEPPPLPPRPCRSPSPPELSERLSALLAADDLVNPHISHINNNVSYANPEYFNLEFYQQIIGQNLSESQPERIPDVFDLLEESGFFPISTGSDFSSPIIPETDLLIDIDNEQPSNDSVKLRLQEETLYNIAANCSEPAYYNERLSNQPIGQMICFNGWIKAAILKKDIVMWWCILKDRQLVFSPDMESDEIDKVVIDCSSIIFVGKHEEKCFTLVLANLLNKPTAVLQICVESENLRNCWTMLLAKSMARDLQTVELIEGIDRAGPVYVRQGTTGAWKNGWAFCTNKTLTYTQMHDGNFYQVDIRKIKSIKSRLPANDWCTVVSTGSGPFLISLEGSSLYIQSSDDKATALWKAGIEQELFRCSNRLEDQRLTLDDIPVIVDKCIKFIAIHGMHLEGIYRKSGPVSEVRQLETDFDHDPINVHLTVGSDETVHAVAEVLRRFFRKLHEPICTTKLRSELLNIACLPESDLHAKLERYKWVLDQMSTINIATMRKLLIHLKVVTELSAQNKASISNVAKIFGPTLFNIDNRLTPSESSSNDTHFGCFQQMGQEIQVMNDLIANFNMIFDVSEREIRQEHEISGPMSAVALQKKSCGQFLIPIHVFERENQAFNIASKKTAREVLDFTIKHKHLRTDEGPFSLFETVRNGQIERLVSPEESLHEIVVSRWYSWPTAKDASEISGCYLVIKKDNINPKIKTSVPYPFVNDIRFADDGSKSFKKAALQCTGGYVYLYKDAKCSHLLQKWNVEELLWFMGAEVKREPPYRNVLTVLKKTSVPKSNKYFGMCICFKNEHEMYSWLAVFYQFR